MLDPWEISGTVTLYLSVKKNKLSQWIKMSNTKLQQKDETPAAAKLQKDSWRKTVFVSK